MLTGTPFSIARLPKIEFGSGAINKIPGLISVKGNRMLLVTGASSFLNSSHWKKLESSLQDQNITVFISHIETEPSPYLIDDVVTRFKEEAIDVVVAIGGGSALDAGKAIAGLLRVPNSVMDFLEGVGPELEYPGPAVPFIAVPTTAGTGSEATKNAVLSVQAFDGFKKSFRDEQLVPEVAILDPDLLESCPAGLIAANGMDALTQLLESYVSIRANPMTDALAESGLKAIRESLVAWYEGDNSESHRASMLYASLLSGINLAQTGLGSVHGLASPLGAFFPIPHGVVCGTLVHEATKVNIEALREREPDSVALGKYAECGRILSGDSTLNNDGAIQRLLSVLEDWTQKLELPLLKAYGVRYEQLDHVVGNSRGSSMQTNPIVLSDDEIRRILLARMG